MPLGKYLFLALCLFLTVRGALYLSEGFSADCDDRRVQGKTALTNWQIIPQFYSTIKENIDNFDPSFGGSVACFTTDKFPNNLPAGLTFIDLSTACIMQPIQGLAAGKYKLSFNYYNDPQAQTDTETLKVYVIDQVDNSPITNGGETLMTLRQQIYLYKMINFQITSVGVTDVFIVFCDALLDDYTGITNIEVKDWPTISCPGKVQKINMNSDPICVQTQTVTNSIDCFLYQSETQCGGCNQLEQTTHLVNLNTPAKACIEQSNTNYDSYCSLYSYVSDFKCQTCTYLTGESFSSLKVNISNTFVFRCPDDPSFKQQFCTEYVFVNQYLSCQTCPQTLMPGTNLIQVCVKDLIPQCKLYKPDASCDPCASGIPSTGIVCPKTAVSYLDYCLKATKIGTSYMCVACLTGYVLNFRNQCLKMVKFCANYRLKICTTCIQGYVMFEGLCYEPITHCNAYELNGRCKNCSEGFLMHTNGTCFKQAIMICKQTQYLFNGECVDGKIPNCIRFESDSGNCKQCREKYKLTAQKLCQIICPQNKQFEKWSVRNGMCYWQDLRCKNAHPDGYCYECKDGYYAYFGKCYKIGNNF